MSEKPESKGGMVPIVVAIVGALATVISTYIANQKSDQNVQLKGEVIDYKQELSRMTERRDSLVTAYNNLNTTYNELAQRYAASGGGQVETSPPVIPDLVKQEEAEENIFPLPTIAPGKENSHSIAVKRAIGDRKTKQVTIKFLSTNERYDSNEHLYMNESIGTFQGTTYYATGGKLGDKTAEGQDQYTKPAMQTIKGEPISGSIAIGEVPATVSQFSKLVINLNGDRVQFKNVPITWQ